MDSVESVSWQAPNFHYYEKSSAWYIWSIVIAVAVAGIAFFQGNILFAFFAVIAEGLVLILGNQKPKMLVYEMTDSRVISDKYREYPYIELEGFAVIDNPFSERYAELVLSPKKRLGTYIKILVPVERADAVKGYINQFLPEIAYEESLGDNILKRIGL